MCLLGAVALPSTAGATIGAVTTNGAASPTPLNGSTPSGVSLSFGFDATYSGGFSPGPSLVVFHFDNDIAFDTTGLPQCAPASLAGLTTAQALAICGPAKVGSGTVIYNGGSINGVITAFNGTPGKSYDRVVLHLVLDAGPAIDLIGELGPSSRGGDFGTELNVPGWPNNPGLAPTHFAVTLDNLEPAPGHYYVSAGCSDADHTLNFAADFAYHDATTGSASATQVCAPPPTGRRAAALKKCKKKNSKKARKKCRIKANRLPL